MWHQQKMTDDRKSDSSVEICFAGTTKLSVEMNNSIFNLESWRVKKILVYVKEQIFVNITEENYALTNLNCMNT